MNLAKTAYDVAEYRSEERIPLDRRGVLRIGGDPHPHDVVVLDLTREGCRIETDLPVVHGATIEIGLANIGRVQATAVWQSIGNLGCLFDRPLPPGAVTAAQGPTNILSFTADPVPAAETRTVHKLTTRTRLAILGGACVLSWGVICAAVLAIS
ncbi:PilZ domain-containing protein [Sphingomonas sp. gentR]|jgi:hypothetical protein|uniref:PilZ domain-containing protein n=1 Tax=unclassified Sphingomonas TaxID=196159 RepID=UPI0006F58202|nr:MULTISPECIES: PilZ domain-containing protein [unclassified Sphingomonas]APX66062.1 hypothetical protein AV944_09665 [Sphingomonas sp. LK11]KQO57238.1 hypothetical protein ASF14_16600 [Sphingomonas sp. Leaf257]